MMEYELLVYGLLAFILAREAMHYVTVQKLINKLMSRNFAEYATIAHPKTKTEPQIRPDTSPDEDLASVF